MRPTNELRGFQVQRGVIPKAKAPVLRHGLVALALTALGGCASFEFGSTGDTDGTASGGPGNHR
jgi:hypothetical protein